MSAFLYWTLAVFAPSTIFLAWWLVSVHLARRRYEEGERRRRLRHAALTHAERNGIARPR